MLNGMRVDCFRYSVLNVCFTSKYFNAFAMTSTHLAFIMVNVMV